ncbi:hypothetical protein R1sor_009072 [Riccia sorocarpa]|uniref:Reverse transcriptase domain-containing protein n=1 Tax=Riccia sorocarpa TaxID=122646 RepID=A0ABD3H5B7_9MARC
MMKSKYKREAVESLITEDGTTITEQQEILGEIHAFYQHLFREEADANEGDRQDLIQANLNLVRNKISSEQSMKAEAAPGMAELERFVEMLPPDKSPGLDGVTSETIREFWPVQGQLQGLEAADGRQVLEALFADDTGLLLQAEEGNWSAACGVIAEFERMSGARLNISKSLVVPIGFSEPPNWLRATGCKIALEGEVWSYLGCPIGVKLTEEQILQLMLDKITKRLNTWTNRLLSWESRLVLTRHILMALPTYILMVVGLTADGYKELTRACRRFIWGSTKEGVDKKTWIAWKKMCQRREDGGLGLVGFDLQAKTLKMRLVSKILNQEDLDWIYLMRAIVEWKVLETQCREREIGSPMEDIMLLGNRLQLTTTPTAKRILEGWWEARKWLHLKPGVPLPEGTTIRQALHMIDKDAQKGGGQIASTCRILKRAGVTKVEDLTNERMAEAEEIEKSRGGSRYVRYAEGPVSYVVANTERNYEQRNCENPTSDPSLWVWKRDGVVLEGWIQPTATWRRLLGNTQNHMEKLNRSWQVD